MPSTARSLALIPCLVLIALILWAVRAGDFGEAGRWLTSDPWGIVTLFDLYFGFLLAAIVIAWTERKLLPAVFWITPVFVLGNVWTALWLLVRGRKLWAALSEFAATNQGKTTP